MYHIFLEREDDGKSEFSPISLQEFKAVAEIVPDLKYTNTIEYVSTHGETIVRSGQHYLRWNQGEHSTYFKFDDGVISAEYDSVNLQKMYEFSKHFHGYVYGELGEEY